MFACCPRGWCSLGVSALLWMISHGHESCGSNRVSHRLSDWDVAWFTRSLQLNFACTSAPLLPTWHAQRQVESRRCSAGLTLKDFERSNEFKWQIMRCICVWIFFGILQNPSDSLDLFQSKATERTNLDATCHDFRHHIITPAFSSIPSTSIRRTLHLNLVKLDDIWGMSSLAAALVVWFVQDFKELCDVFVSILMLPMAHGLQALCGLWKKWFGKVDMSLSSTETDYRSYFMCAIMMEFYHLFLLTSGDGSPNMFPQQDLRVLVVSSRNLFQTVEKRKRPNA